jgi:phosphoribosylanthranilate isomerase
MVVVQVYNMSSVEDAKAVSVVGADHVGTQVALKHLPFTVNARLGNEISRAVRPVSKSVIIPISHDPARIIEIARKVEPDIVQLANEEGRVERGVCMDLMKDLSKLGFRTIKVIAVGAGSELESAKFYAARADIIMTDSAGAPPSGLLSGYIGGTGKTHDWSISAEIVRRVERPTILAGGLNLQNLTRAIEAVKPWGVDAATALDIPGSGGKKDVGKVREFVRLAKQYD